MTAIYALVMLYALWVLYLLVMGLYRAWLLKKLSPVTMLLGLPFLVLGGLLDVVVNLMVSVVLLELPKEFLLTQRLTRHLKGEGWRKELARWVCEHLLDPFDPRDGGHCVKR